MAKIGYNHDFLVGTTCSIYNSNLRKDDKHWLIINMRLICVKEVIRRAKRGEEMALVSRIKESSKAFF